ncbi:MAG TPA: GNAT family N-acetyltransferase [Pyrinomonadaceae bacterium]|jgi:GNAT superfamily N-acetyltransferase
METKPLDKLHDRASFDCGVEPLNEYLKKYALQNQKKDAARTFVLTTQENRILAYYTLVFGSVSFEETTADISAGLGKYPIPVILLARLAIDAGEKGKGLGKTLLRDALLRAVSASEIAGLRAFLVHAKDAAAKAFYEKFGFEPSPHNEFHLFLKIADIRASLADEE